MSPEVKEINTQNPETFDQYVNTQLAKYDLPDAKIEQIKQQCFSLKVKDVNDKFGYEQCRKAQTNVRTLRTGIEKTRKELKESALKYGRVVDERAKTLTASLIEIEEHLKTQRKIVDDEIERKKREAEEARKREEEAKRKAEEERLEKIRLENERKQREEAERLEKQRKEQEEKERKIREEQEKIEEEKRNIEAEKQRADEERKQIEERKKQMEFDRRAGLLIKAGLNFDGQDFFYDHISLSGLEVENMTDAQFELKRDSIRIEVNDIKEKQAKEKAEAEEKARKEAEEKAREDERQRIEAEQKAKAEAERKAKEEAERAERLKPDIDKIHAFAKSLKALKYPDVKDSEAVIIMMNTKDKINNIALHLVSIQSF